MARNARFWVFENGSWCKLTLAEGQRLTHVEGGPTDEGYSYTSSTWEHTAPLMDEPAAVYAEYTSWGRDCDGLHECGGEVFCPLEDLAAVEPMGEGDPPAPAWQSTNAAWQRDHTAEAAGY